MDFGWLTVKQNIITSLYRETGNWGNLMVIVENWDILVSRQIFIGTLYRRQNPKGPGQTGTSGNLEGVSLCVFQILDRQTDRQTDA